MPAIPRARASSNRLTPIFWKWPTRLLDDEAELHGLKRPGPNSANGLTKSSFLGIGGSSMGPRALFSALCDPYHNERPRDARRNAPRIYFEGDNLDNNSLVALLDPLAHITDQRWRLLVTSKSGNTIETAIALRVFLSALEAKLGDAVEVAESLAVMTGAESPLRHLAVTLGCSNIFTLPDRLAAGSR
ncbi:MAG: hypothetical protein Ct9H300mP1_20200 [Planctomycetaceae bacterium]|nr:MAG: hypothetical protein Ct9H300mP1_20200 [Planctomycetaceae bacterium]